MLKIEKDLDLFLALVNDDLEKSRSIHSLMLSILTNYKKLNKNVQLMASDVSTVGVQSEKERPLLISKATKEAAANFADELFAKQLELPGVNGPNIAADSFAEKWCQLTQKNKKLGLNLRLFELRQVTPPPQSSGHFRLAESKDEALLLAWLKEFHHEAIPHDPLSSDERLLQSIQSAVEKKSYYLWEDQGETVCWVASGRETEFEAWIAPVYTPKKYRGRGYASQLVAKASQDILDKNKVALLFTDLSNPTSNSIYQKMGYKALADFRHWIFE